MYSPQLPTVQQTQTIFNFPLILKLIQFIKCNLLELPVRKMFLQIFDMFLKDTYAIDF